MIEAKIINKIDFPKITLQSDLEYAAENIIIPDMMNRIIQRKAIDGGKLPDNEQSTINKKGGRDTQLRDTDTLLNSFIYGSEKDKVTITLGQERYEIGSYLQSGIKTNHGYKAYKFFGISIFAYRKIITYMKKRLNEILDARK